VGEVAADLLVRGKANRQFLLPAIFVSHKTVLIWGGAKANAGSPGQPLGGADCLASDETNMNSETKASPPREWGKTLAWIAAWVWTVIAGGGGWMLLLEKGPLPLTNGWFALLSGIAACPLTASFLKKYAGITLSGRVQFAAALAFFIAGRIALTYP
jgi:hypothetical protein